MMPQPFISVHNLCMDFDDTRVLNNVSFEIPEGEIMGVRHKSLPVEGVQFHPESILTESGRILLRNFVES